MEGQVWNNWPWQIAWPFWLFRIRTLTKLKLKIVQKIDLKSTFNEKNPYFTFAFIQQYLRQEKPKTVTKKTKPCNWREYTSWKWLHSNEVVFNKEKRIFVSGRANDYEMETVYYPSSAPGLKNCPVIESLSSIIYRTSAWRSTESDSNYRWDNFHETMFSSI